jgi:hypothetical protein
MTPLFRVEMFVLALLFLAYVFRTINKRKLQMRFSVIWIVLALGLMVIALFPGIVLGLTSLAGMEVPANLLYLCAIFILLVITFSHTVQLSAQAEKVKGLVQHISLEQYLREEEK